MNIHNTPIPKPDKRVKCKVNELNRENERRLLRPLVIAFLVSVFLAPLLIILVITFGDEVDRFASKYPELVGISLIVLSAWGWFKFGKSRGLW